MTSIKCNKIDTHRKNFTTNDHTLTYHNSQGMQQELHLHYFISGETRNWHTE